MDRALEFLESVGTISEFPGAPVGPGEEQVDGSFVTYMGYRAVLENDEEWPWYVWWSPTYEGWLPIWLYLDLEFDAWYAKKLTRGICKFELEWRGKIVVSEWFYHARKFCCMTIWDRWLHLLHEV